MNTVFGIDPNTVHCFNESLIKSNSQVDNPIWERIYRSAFPTFETMVSVREDGWAQRGGVDRQIILKSGKVISVDEKVRGKDYGDILLEYWSDEGRKTKGWVAKDLACDYIAYAIIPSSRCYLLPFPTLRRAWFENRIEWVRNHREVRAENMGYVTVSVAVPVNTLMDSIKNSMLINF